MYKTERTAWYLNENCENQVVQVSLDTNVCPFLRGGSATTLEASVAPLPCCEQPPF